MINLLSFHRHMHRACWQLFHAFHYAMKSIQNAKLNFCVGFLACLLVVCVVAVLDTSLAMAPVVFLRIAESDQGEIDFMMSAGTWTGHRLLNYQQMEAALNAQEETKHHAPRIVLGSVPLYLDRDCHRQANESIDSLDWKYVDFTSSGKDRTCRKSFFAADSCFKERCPSAAANVDLYIIDQAKEKAMICGRNYTLPPAAVGELFLVESMHSKLAVQPGDIIYLSINVWWHFYGMNNDVFGEEGLEYSTQYVVLPLSIADNHGAFSSGLGKFPLGRTSIAVMDYSNFWPQLSANVNPKATARTRQLFTAANLYHFARQVIVNLPSPRENSYLDSSYDDIQRTLTQWGTKVAFQVGFHAMEKTMPTLNALFVTNWFSLFLGLIINIIITMMTILSIMLIYSLLLISVESRVFEMGVLRLIGATRFGILQMLLVQALLYGFPAVVVGLFIAQCMTSLLALVFYFLTALTVNPILRLQSVLLASALGLGIPVVASIVPIKAALRQNVHDALDTLHSKTVLVAVSIQRSSTYAFPSTQFIIGLVMMTFGLLIYYLFPLALLSVNLTLLLYIFFGLILGMLLGMAMLVLSLEQLLEKFVVYIFCWWEKSAIITAVIKNQSAHRRRNKKTSLMYALSLGFIVFMSVSFQLQSTSFGYQLQQRNGCYMKVYASGIDLKTRVSRTIARYQLFEGACQNSSICQGFAWVSAPLVISMEDGGSSGLENLGHAFKAGTSVYAISSDYFEVTIDGFLLLDGDEYPWNRAKRWIDAWLSPSPVKYDEELYTTRGSYRMLIGSARKKQLALDIDSHFLLRTVIKTIPLALRFLDRLGPVEFFDLVPGFTFSKYEIIREQDALVSFPTFVRLSNGRIKSVEDVPKATFLLHINPNAPEIEKDKLNAALTNLAKPHQLGVWDYRDSLEPIRIAEVIMLYFFVFTLVVAMITCFFSLLSSMYANIAEQTKEIGVLRAVGMPKFWVMRLYIYEAFALIVASSILGALIGTFVGWTMTAQTALFTQLPLPFAFPWQLLCSMIMLAMLSAVFATVFPLQKVLRKSPIAMMREL